MVVRFIDKECADDTGFSESPYFTALLGVSTPAYQKIETANAISLLSSGDSLHIAEGVYFPPGQIGGAAFRRYFYIYGDVRIDGLNAGNVHAIFANGDGWYRFIKGTRGAIFWIQNYTNSVLKQMLYASYSEVTSDVPIVITDCPESDGVRCHNVTATRDIILNTLILNNLRHGVYADGSVANNVTITNFCTNKVNRDVYALSSTHNININQSYLARSYGFHGYAESAWAGTLTYNNCISIGGAAPHNDIYPFTKLTGIGTMNINNSFILPAPRFAKTTFQTVDTNVTSDQPVLKNSFMNGSVSFNIDDSKNETAFEALVAECNSRGLKCGWAIDWQERDMTPAKWDLARLSKSQGHDLYIHTTHSANMSDLFSFRIQYTGLGTAVSLDIVGDSLTTTVDAAQDLNIVLSTYDSVIDLVTFINTQTDYSAETFDQDTVRVGVILGAASVKYAGEPSTEMFGTQNETDIKSAPADISYNSELFFTRQITDNVNAIAENTGYTPTSMVYPGGEHAGALEETIESYGVHIARATLPLAGFEKYYPDDIDPLNMSSWPVGYIAPTTDSEAVRRQKLIGFFEWVKATGAQVNLWEHGLVAYSQAQWALVLDVAVECEVPVTTLTEQAIEMRKGTRSVSSGQITYSQDISQAFVDYCFNFEYIDGFAGEFKGLKHWSNSIPKGIDGIWFPDWDITIGPKQSKKSNGYPLNV